MRFIVLSASLLLAAGCQGPAPTPDSPYGAFQIPAGTQFVLNRELRFPPEIASLYIQRGELTTIRSGAQEVFPYCIFTLDIVPPDGFTVTPDTFSVFLVRRPIESFSAVAGRRYAGMGGDEGPTQIFYKTRMFLRSAVQPEVRQLTCQVDRMTTAGTVDEFHLSVADIREALGEMFTVRLPEEFRQPPRGGGDSS